MIEGDLDIAIMEELDGGASSLLISDFNLTNLLQAPTQNASLIKRMRNHKKERKNIIAKLTQNESISSVPLSFSHLTDVFCENPELVDRENIENWTDAQLISERLNKDMIGLRNLVKCIFGDKEYFTEDRKSYLYLFNF